MFEVGDRVYHIHGDKSTIYIVEHVIEKDNRIELMAPYGGMSYYANLFRKIDLTPLPLEDLV